MHRGLKEQSRRFTAVQSPAVFQDKQGAPRQGAFQQKVEGSQDSRGKWDSRLGGRILAGIRRDSQVALPQHREHPGLGMGTGTGRDRRQALLQELWWYRQLGLY
jgi:hypothetical protein